MICSSDPIQKLKIAAGETYHFSDDFSIAWAEYLNTVSGWIGKAPSGSISFWLAWTLGSIFETLLVPFGIRSPHDTVGSRSCGKGQQGGQPAREAGSRLGKPRVPE